MLDNAVYLAYYPGRGFHGYVDKLGILKQFERLALGNALETDEIRLYLLFLAYCRDPNRGEIAYRTVKDALGEEMSPARFKRTCLRLARDNLIDVGSDPFPEIIGEEYVLAYRIFLHAGATVEDA